MALNPSSGWSYYKEIQISDTADVSADYQMKLTVYAGSGDDNTADGIIYCNNHCEDFPNDIRFGTTNDPSTATQLAQWIEESDATSATIWVKCPSDGSDTFYMFVGNSSASQYSDGDDTFLLFDHFDGTNLDTNKWTAVKKGSNDAIIELDGNSNLHLAGVDGVTASANVRSSISFVNNIAIELRHKITDSQAAFANVAIGHGDLIGSWCGGNWFETGLEEGYMWEIRYPEECLPGYNLTILIMKYKTCPGYFPTEVIKHSDEENLSSLNEWHRMVYIYDSEGHIKWYHDGTPWVSTTNTTYLNNTKNLLLSEGSWSDVQECAHRYIDWVFVRKYNPTEPTWSSFGSWTEISGGGGQAYETTLTDSISLASFLQRFLGIEREDIFSLNETTLFKPTSQMIDSFSLVAYSSLCSKIEKSEAFTIIDIISLTVFELLMDIVNITDTSHRAISILRKNDISLVDSEISRLYQCKTLTDFISLLDSLLKNLISKRIFDESLSLIDSLNNTISAFFTQVVTLYDIIRKRITKIKSEAISLFSTMTEKINAVRSETVSLTDKISRNIALLKQELIIAADSKLFSMRKRLSEMIELLSRIGNTFHSKREESLTLTDKFIESHSLLQVNTISLLDDIYNSFRKEKLLISSLSLLDRIAKAIHLHKFEVIPLTAVFKHLLPFIGNLRISTSNYSFGVMCSSWKEDSYSIVIEFIADKGTRDKLISDIVPGAVAQLYNLLGEPKFIDTTYEGKNTITLTPRRGLSTLKDPVTVAVKRYAETMIRWNTFKIKLECVKL